MQLQNAQKTYQMKDTQYAHQKSNKHQKDMEKTNTALNQVP